MDLISRQAAIEQAEKKSQVEGAYGYMDTKSIVDMLEDLPKVDAVEVVRCKDCKHLFDGEHNANCCEVLMRKAKWLTEITVDMNWYCADRERRTDERSD